MNREEGFYWVKQYEGADWDVLEYKAANGWPIGDNWANETVFLQDHELFAINETRILTPDEIK